MSASRWAVVVTGGGPLSSTAVRAVHATGDRLGTIAADGGLDHAVSAELSPTHLVGDLDSLSAGGRMWAYAHGVEIDEHPADKDLTDTELALSTAARLAAPGDRLLVVGGTGDRLDHLLGILLALGGPAAARFDDVRAVIGDTSFVVVHAPRHVELDLAAGQTFSVMALHGPCLGAEVDGARWSLAGDLLPTEARGLSNVADGTVTVAVAAGVLTVAVPS